MSTDDLRLKDGNRLPHQGKTPGKLQGDHAGHLIGDRFGGSPELDNLVSQTSDVNLSKFKTIENEWADALAGTPPQRVQMSVKVNYPEGSVRPSSFEVKYKIGD